MYFRRDKYFHSYNITNYKGIWIKWEDIMSGQLKNNNSGKNVKPSNDNSNKISNLKDKAKPRIEKFSKEQFQNTEQRKKCNE